MQHCEKIHLVTLQKVFGTITQHKCDIIKTKILECVTLFWGRAEYIYKQMVTLFHLVQDILDEVTANLNFNVYSKLNERL